jgi:hypothetical protein
MRRSQLEVTAYHEAGHAVVAASFGRAVAHLTIVARNGRLGGSVSEDAPTGWRPRHAQHRDAWTDCIVYHAGHVAETIAFGRCEGGCHDDLRAARAAMAPGRKPVPTRRPRVLRPPHTRLRNAALDRQERRVQAAARALLMGHWHAVRRLAALLLEHGSIDGQIVDVAVTGTDDELRQYLAMAGLVESAN